MDTKKTVDKLVKNIQKYFKDNGRKTAVIGISGGKDSLVAAMLLKEAIGAENILGILLPEGNQKDINDANLVTNLLGIKQSSFNILPLTAALPSINLNVMMPEGNVETVMLEEQSVINAKPRIRMAVLYYLAQSLEDAVVVCTSNAAENYVGYTTKFGDTGDICPLRELYVDEVLEIGEYLIKKYFEGEYEYIQLTDILSKAPSDGIRGKADEDVLGFTYAEVKDYSLKGTCGDKKKDALIKDAHDKTEHKRKLPVVIGAGIKR